MTLTRSHSTYLALLDWIGWRTTTETTMTTINIKNLALQADNLDLTVRIERQALIYSTAVKGPITEWTAELGTATASVTGKGETLDAALADAVRQTKSFKLIHDAALKDE
jgi:hypothetical protein